MHNIDDNLTVIDLLDSHSGVPTLNEAPTTPASGTKTGTAVNTYGEARKLLALLHIGFNRNSNSLRVVIQESADGTTYTTLYTFADKTATGSVAVDLTPAKKYIRAYATLGATGTNYIVFNVKGAFYNERYRPSNVA